MNIVHRQGRDRGSLDLAVRVEQKPKRVAWCTSHGRAGGRLVRDRRSGLNRAITSSGSDGLLSRLYSGQRTEADLLAMALAAILLDNHVCQITCINLTNLSVPDRMRYFSLLFPLKLMDLRIYGLLAHALDPYNRLLIP